MSTFDRFELARDEEASEGIAALAQIIGAEEASKPSWIRRLARAKETGEWCLAIASCVPISRGRGEWVCPWNFPNGLEPLPLAYTLAEGVAILKSDDNPEKELDRRRALLDAHIENMRRIEEEQRQRLASEAAAQRRAIQESQKFREREWQEDFTDLGRFALGLAVLVEKRDQALADDLRVIAREGLKRNGPASVKTLRVPLAEWWKVPSQGGQWQWWERATKPAV